MKRILPPKRAHRKVPLRASDDPPAPGEEPKVYEPAEKLYTPRPVPLENDERQELESEEIKEGDEPAGDLDFTPKTRGRPRLR